MQRTIRLGAFLAILFFVFIQKKEGLKAQDPKSVESRLEELARSSAGRAQVLTYGQSYAGQPLKALEWLPAGRASDSLPEVVLIGGIDPQRPYTVSLVLRLAESLMAHRERYTGFRWLFIPQPAPDHAAEVLSPVAASRVNRRPVDEDRDGFIDEDGPDDLNGDGFLTQMRIADPAGPWTTDPADPRVMVLASKGANPTGERWQVYPEGRDDDRDRRWNEDGVGGVAFDCNFPAGYRWHQPTRGREPLSEPENLALAQLLIARPQVALVWVFGADDNLSQPWKSETGFPVQAVHSKDEPVYEKLGQLYVRQLRPPKGSGGVSSGGGNLVPWLYRQQGWWVFATPGWHLPLKSQPDSSASDSLKKSLAKGAESKNAEVRAHLYAEQQGLANYYVPWQRVEHPDFPGQRVEVGGLIGWRAYQPVDTALTAAVERQRAFVDTVVHQMCRWVWRVPDVERLSGDLYRVRAYAAVQGLLPTHTAPAAELIDVPLNRWHIRPGRGQRLVEHAAHGTFGRLEAGQNLLLDIVIQGAGKLELVVGHPRTGYAKLNIDVR